ncbi:MAG: hypothetical protein ACRDHP_17770 [Ktedonobacterales bacterium]
MRSVKCRTIGGVPTSSPVSLALSLVFGAGQLVVGAGVAYHLLARSEWRRPNRFLLLLIALWFVASGVTELFVSGMETAHGIAGAPSLAEFTLWRGRADTTLVVVSALLVAVLLSGVVVRRIHRIARGRASGS